MIEDDDDVGEGTSNHDVMGISSYRDHKTTSSFLNSMSNSHAAGDGTSGTGFFQFPHQQNTFHGYEPSAAVYDSAGMLSEMFDFGAGGRQSAPVELLNHQISGEHLFFTKPSPPPIQDHNFHSPQFTWMPEGTTSGAVAGEAQGLSLSLASTAQEMMFFNSGAGQEPRHHFGFGAPSSSSSVFSLSAVNVLRNSKFTRPAQELLEEFCSVGRGGHNQKKSGGGSGGFGNSDTKESPALSPAERMEHQRRKVKLTTMLDEVERRYSHYCEQLQMVVNSYEMVMGFGAAVPYTALAQKAMSRHFRCLKDGVQGQLRHSCEVLGEKALAGGMGITKGETPRLKMLEQNLRKQRAFHQMGIMEQEAWRPQRGLPERSVNILRAWLFEHFLHPYPSDADKHLLARQTGLSRNQVANWFINARVRLWKPMIEEMYQKESKEVQEDEDNDEDNNNNNERESTIRTTQTPTLLPPLPSTSSSSAPTTTHALAITDNDPSPSLFVSSESTHHHHRHHHPITAFPTPSYSDTISLYGTTSSPAGNSSTSGGGVGPTMIRFGTTTPSSGDVSLTLGLRHGAAARNPDPDKTGFSFTDFH